MCDRTPPGYLHVLSMVHGGLGEFAVVEIRESLPAREVLNLDIISIFLLIYFRFTAIIV